MTIEIVPIQADITMLSVDAIVNAANNSLLGGGGVDGAIHRAAGPKLLAYCRDLQGCETGDAVYSPGFELPAKAVIHTVGPVWQGGDSNEAALLQQCYHRCIAVADDKDFRTIAFPAISCGVFGYPHGEAIALAVASIRAATAASSLEKVYVVAYSEEMLTHWRNALAYR
ncbi:MAG: O-acetyl-ADP-ribose deacetylase [Spongiibacteraceae bacterium]